MKKILTTVITMVFVVSFAIVTTAAEQTYSLKGPVVSVDSKAKTVTVNSIEGVTTAADNIWKGEVTFVTDKKTKISMDKKKKTFKDIKAGQDVAVEFHKKDGKLIANQIMITSGKKAK
jgi:hypothetical protein